MGSSEDGGGDDDGGGGSDAQGSEEGLPEDLGGAASLRRGARAAGDDPLQKGLRALTAELLLKHGGKPTVQSLRDLEERGGGSESGSGEQSEEAGMQSGEEGSKGGESAQEEGSDGEDTAPEEGSEGGSGGDTDVDGSDAGSMDAEEQAALAAQMDAAQRAAGLPAGAEGDGGDSAGSSDDDLLELLKQAIAMKRGEGRDASAAGGSGGKAGKRDAQQRGEAAAAAGSGEARNADRRAEVAERDAAAAAAEEEAALAQLPQAPRVPQAAAELAEMAAGLPGRAVGALVDRIRSANAAALNADHRVGLQAFYGVAMGHFAAAAGARPPRRREVEGLVPALTAIAAEVPLYAAMHARTHLRAMFDTAHDALEECAPRPPVAMRRARTPASSQLCIHRTTRSSVTTPFTLCWPCTRRAAVRKSVLPGHQPPRGWDCRAGRGGRGGRGRAACCCCASSASCSARGTPSIPSACRRPSCWASCSPTARPRACTTWLPACSSPRCSATSARPPGALPRRCCRSARRCCTAP